MTDALIARHESGGQLFALPDILTPTDVDNRIRWRAGERLHHLFERRCDSLDHNGQRTHPALDVGGVIVTFSELDRRANQFARHLAANGVRPGDRVALLLDRSVNSYIALLAVLKAGAAFVPLDVRFPHDRVAFITADAGVSAAITTPAGRAAVEGLDLKIFDLDAAILASADENPSRLAQAGLDETADELSYIIYTSGSTGRPKGVAVNHSSICNFVAVAAEIYQYRTDDRVYQGMTLAFDFSVEELWVPLIAGATLVPSPSDTQLVGADLARFLNENRISALCCVPTLLATLDCEVPSLRFLLVSGEACPQDLVGRWHRPGRRMINAYGPTEATVTATWTELAPGRPVTIGIPLPTYVVVMLDPDTDALVAPGAVGEIGIAGIGLAVGYVNRNDLTAKAFIPDFLGLPDNPSHRIYRTGDLGRINARREIDYLGRIDTQVKIRGYRVELAEIENVILRVPGISQAVVTKFEVEPGLAELVAYYTTFAGAAKPSQDLILETLRARLPGYMIPAFQEELDAIPMLPSDKADRKALPPPKGSRLVTSSHAHVAPEGPIETAIAAALGETLRLETVSARDHFFDELGAHSLVMAQFLSRLQARLPDADVSISDTYIAPSVSELAALISSRQGISTPRAKAAPAAVASDFAHALCGGFQLLFYSAMTALYLGAGAAGASWIVSTDSATSILWRSFAVSALAFAVFSALPITAKWLLIGRWRAETFPIWSFKYLRFWVVRQLIETSPLAVFRGSPLFNLYLRLLGARIGRDAVLHTRNVPICTDVISIGSRTVLRKQSILKGFTAENGFIRIGAIDIGDDVVVGEGSVIDIETRIGDGGQLAHASSLQAGCEIPPDRSYHGSPAVETTSDFRQLPVGTTSLRRKIAYSFVQVCLAIGLTALGATTVLYAIANVVLTGKGNSVAATMKQAEPFGLGTIATVLSTSLVLFVAGYVALLAAHLIMPRLLKRMLVAGRTYPLYGAHYLAAQSMLWVSNAPLFHVIFGDSSFITTYLSWLGYRQPGIQQTGSNYGTSTLHDSPAHCEIGSGVMVSDGLSMINFEMGNASFRVRDVSIGEGSFVGNNIVYPAAAQAGRNCLFASKVMLPIDGPVRENVGLLGSPSFEIPRQVVGEEPFDPVPKTPAARAQLARKDRHSLATVGLYLLQQWALVFILLLMGAAATDITWTYGAVTGLAFSLLIPTVAVAYFIALEWASLGFGRLQPRNCTIHDPYFWVIERHWKLGETPLKYLFRGTPFRPMMLRWLGVDMGRKIYDDGSVITEKTLTRIGDNCTINQDVSIQAHSLEDGLFKSDRIDIGNGCTLGANAYVHYGTRLGDNTILEPDSFLMKGTTTEPSSIWQGNPARRR